MNTPSITVGLVTHNSTSTLRACLESILNNSHPDFEILVIDNNSSDGSLQLAHETLRNSGRPFHLIARGHNNLSEARNNVIELAQGELIAFTDPDCEVPQRWLTKMSEQLATELVVGVGGANTPPLGHWLSDLYLSFGRSYFAHFGSSQVAQGKAMASCDQISTCNALYRKDALAKVGGFTVQEKNFGEDLDLSYKLRRNGGILKFCGDNKVVHHLPDKLRPWLKKCFTYGSAQIPTLKRNGWRVSHTRLAPALILPVLLVLFCTYPDLIFQALAMYFLMAIALTRKLKTMLIFAATQWAYLVGYLFGMLMLITYRHETNLKH